MSGQAAGSADLVRAQDPAPGDEITQTDDPDGPWLRIIAAV